ncbi:hypothetical protein [Kibdelosporangium phytohabitans]|uniref:Uncharacterized protein n=1 Tax=Kibdelosporangium phytohabitans TaxID=860235 RepID=A0A0N9I4W5_9PSEU|nr:hypothetical protein [Kibdelosporangium phytohabitans]ALG09689.1 hypothetical protein AOZ06_24775 [Kibdelosporangium phytohabitans]MBE1468960.1 hypothetical protein [Kibdelosporangium phytohabitans]
MHGVQELITGGAHENAPDDLARRVHAVSGGSSLLSTVEQHLTHIYRKLAIGGRSDLPSVLLQTADECECVTEVAGHDERDSAVG